MTKAKKKTVRKRRNLTTISRAMKVVERVSKKIYKDTYVSPERRRIPFTI